MDWRLVREHYKRLFESSGRTQTDVARAAGLPQSAIHKLMANTGDGPSVETLLRAVQGLGITLSEFFGQVEQERSRDGSAPASPLDRPAQLEHFDQTVIAEFIRLRAELEAIRRTATGAAGPDKRPDPGDAGEPVAPPGARRRRPDDTGDPATPRGRRHRRIA
jgi:transcriptional regulator with XRE-family HTH domain